MTPINVFCEISLK